MRKLIVVDPRRTETAELADLHIPVRPGADAFLLGALLAILVKRGAIDQAFIDQRTVGFESVRDALLRIPADAWAKAADVPMATLQLRETRGNEHDGLLLPAQVAETYFHLTQQHRSCWTHELDLRAFSDRAWWNH